MRFFTPELYRRFNSPDDGIADVADAEWEAAVADYRRHLEEIVGLLPESAVPLTELSWHDAELLSFDKRLPTGEPFSFLPWPAIAFLAVRQGGNLVVTDYVLWDDVRERREENWPFSTERVHVLYDEIDLDHSRPGHFLHRLLFSDGRTLEIPFVYAATHTFSEHAVGTTTNQAVPA